jgi:predicted nucleic acid-binding protein
MELIVDANILIAALLKDSHTRKLLMFSNYTFYTCEYVIEEIDNHIQELEKKTRLDKDKLIEILKEIIQVANIKIIPLTEFENHILEAKNISPDKYDIQYFALALNKKCPIWSNDKKLKTQHQIIIYTTTEITILQI